MTKLDALSLIGQGLKCLMDSERPCRDKVAAVEYTLDGTTDDCELIVNFVGESDDAGTGRVKKEPACFMVKAEEIEEAID
ncbi:MAG TPA: hypothetical protein VGG61_02485 [Gemmataceae bacterium]|jgi:hypothetical protein